MAFIGAKKSKRQIEYLAAYISSGDKIAAGKATNVAKRTWQRWFQNDPDFAKHTERIEKTMFDGIEDRLLPVGLKRAEAGSDILLMFFLKAANRQRYDDGIAKQALANAGLKEAIAELPTTVYEESPRRAAPAG